MIEIGRKIHQFLLTQRETKQLKNKETSEDEPFGRQPQPVTITITGELIDVRTWMNHIKRTCEFKGDLIQSVNETTFKIYPRAVND